MGKLWKRTNEPARPLDELDKSIPQPLSEIVRKCLEIDPQKRFATAAELLQHIEIWQGPAAGTRIARSDSGQPFAGVRKMGGRWAGSRRNCGRCMASPENGFPSSRPSCAG